MASIVERIKKITEEVFRTKIIYICLGKHLRPIDSKDKVIFHIDI